MSPSYVSGMPTSQQLLQEALALDETERRELAYHLLGSIVDELDQLSADEQARLEAVLEISIAQADAGECIPAEQVLAQLHAKRAGR